MIRVYTQNLGLCGCGIGVVLVFACGDLPKPIPGISGAKPVNTTIADAGYTVPSPSPDIPTAPRWSFSADPVL